jgi:hypothetical protein
MKSLDWDKQKYIASLQLGQSSPPTKLYSLLHTAVDGRCFACDSKTDLRPAELGGTPILYCPLHSEAYHFFKGDRRCRP